MATTILKDESRELPFDESRLLGYIDEVTAQFPHLKTEVLKDKMISKITARETFPASKITQELLLSTQDLIGLDRMQTGDVDPDWTFVSSQIFLNDLYKRVARLRGYAGKKYGDFYGLLKKLGEMGIYSSLLLKEYSEEEIREAESFIDPERDKLFTYIGIRTLASRYLARDYTKNIYELPQERFLIIAMALMSKENVEFRMQLVKEAYWALANHYMTVATPTLSNAGKNTGQYSSCFIDTIDDSLRSIYDSNTDIATLSKAGGGIGVYFGKVRSIGSAIKGFKGASGGVVPWLKQANNTAVSVDQLGTRKGAIAVYVDVWTRDIFDFLDLKLNNGDERRRAHDLFTGVCLPDLFMEQVEKRADWYLFDPHEVRTVMGWNIEDHFDEEKGKGTFRDKYWEIVDNPSIEKVRVPAIDIMKRIMISQLETGTPYMFYRDEVNRMNANSHKGMIYCSNLCTEITQNQSPTTLDQETLETVDGEIKIVSVKTPGDFVVCNLSSINLARAVMDDVLERLIPIQVRMLDNVIDLNSIEVLQAKATNQKYRAVGLGTFGWHHLLALKGIKWESKQAVNYSDELYEQISFLTIQASMELSKEKGAYPVFHGSDWETGKYFEKRGYILSDEVTEETVEWESLADKVATYGIRNGYLMAVAPNMSTSIIVGSTASIDPIFKMEYSEEKKDYKIPVTAPDLTPATYWFYSKSAFQLDQKWSIAQNAKRQRHIDQAISFNLYVNPFIKASELLDLHMTAWKSGLKTTYYVRSQSKEDYSECESCT